MTEDICLAHPAVVVLLVLLVAILGISDHERRKLNRVDICQHQGHSRAECWRLEKGYSGGPGARAVGKAGAR